MQHSWLKVNPVDISSATMNQHTFTGFSSTMRLPPDEDLIPEFCEFGICSYVIAQLLTPWDQRILCFGIHTQRLGFVDNFFNYKKLEDEVILLFHAWEKNWSFLIGQKPFYSQLQFCKIKYYKIYPIFTVACSNSDLQKTLVFIPRFPIRRNR